MVRERDRERRRERRKMKRERGREINRVSSLGLHLNIDQFLQVRKLPKQGKETPERIRRNSSWGLLGNGFYSPQSECRIQHRALDTVLFKRVFATVL